MDPDKRSSPPPPAPGGGGRQRSRSRSPPPVRSNRRRRSRSPASRSASPPPRRRRSSRSRSRSGGGGGGGGRRRGRSRSWSRSRSRSRSPRSRSRPHRDDHRDRGPPMRRGPPPDFRGDFGRYDHGPPPFGGDPYGHPRGPPPPYGDFPPYGGPPFGPPPPFHPHPHHHPPMPPRRGGGGGGGGGGGRRGDEGAPGVSLLIRNVSPDITQNDLQMAFGRIGEVRDVYIPRDYHSQQPKGFAFIEYATAEMAREAREEMDRFLIKGREIEVVYAQEKRKSPNEMRSRVVNPQNRERPGFERSSSFERHKQRSRDDPKGPKRSSGSQQPPDEQDDRPPRSNG